MPHIALSIPSSPELDPHLAGMFGLVPRDLPQAERAVIPIGHWGPWPLSVVRKGDAWFVASDAAWLERLLDLRRPLRPRLAGLLGELIRSQIPERGATPPSGVIRVDAAATFAVAADMVPAMREHVDPAARLPLAVANRIFTDAGAILPDASATIETRPDDHHGVEIHGENLPVPLLLPVVFGWLEERGALPVDEDPPDDFDRHRPPPDDDRRPRDKPRFRPPRGERRR